MREKKLFLIPLWLSFFVFCAVGLAKADDLTSTDFQVLAPVFAPASLSTSDGFQLLGSIGEPGAGPGTAPDFGINAGFLNFPFASTPAVSATPGNGQVALSWTASQGFLGWVPSSYTIGRSSTQGGPYVYTNVGNVTSSTVTGLTNGTGYYFVVVADDVFGNAIASSTEVSATPVSPGGGSSPGPGGNGGASGGSSGGSSSGVSAISPLPGGASVILSGRAYPGSSVTVLRDGTIVSQSVIQQSAAFSVTVGNLQPGTYLFSVYATDSQGQRSTTVTMPVTVTAAVTATVSGIFLAPTISVDKSEVKQGDPITVFGQSAPSSTVTISVHSTNELFFQTPTDQNGVYSYSFLTTPLQMGQHTTDSISSQNGEVSRASASVAFTVGTEDISNATNTATTASIPGDFQGNGRVDIADFSIEAFWYNKPNAPAKYRLDGKAIVDLTDFSIMAYHWTG